MSLLVIAILLILAGGGCALALRHHPRTADGAFLILVLAGCILGGVIAAQVLLGTQIQSLAIASTLPGGDWITGVDRLSAWFILLTCIVAAATATFGVEYLGHERPYRSIGPTHAMFALLVAAMLGVFIARAAVLFLVVWELMALSAYFLIVFDHDRAEVRRAGLVYLVLTHVGTLALLTMFLLWGRSAPDLSFGQLTPSAAHLAWNGVPLLFLALIGFGIKSGIFPFHFWLPGAHASAPSHVSALLSGVMIKTGVYGLLRVLMLFGAPPGWWAWMLLLLGMLSALLGVLWALTQHDLKRALAYSSIDNIGIIVMGIALGSLGIAYHHPTLALLGFTAALLHSMNHALFKSLLFLSAGGVGRASGTLQIDRLGGLARAMPKTAAAFLIGSVAVVGLPPLNGFVGEWTLIRGFLNAGIGSGAIRFAGLGAAVVGLVGALTLACFLRLGSTVFLGHPRFAHMTAPRDIARGMVVGPAWLALGCLIIGVAPGLVLTPARQVAATMSPEVQALTMDGSFGGAPTQMITALALSLVLLCAVLWAIRMGAARRYPHRRSATWGCAYPAATARMQYTAASFSAPVARAFAMSDGPALIPPIPGAERRGEDRVLRDLANPAWRQLTRLALQLRPLQQGRVTTYLQYIIGTVLILLGFLFFAGLGRAP